MNRLIRVVSVVCIFLAVGLGVFAGEMLWVMATGPTLPNATPSPARAATRIPSATPTRHPVPATPTPQLTSTPFPAAQAPGSARPLPAIVTNGSHSLREIALTFDDGPSPYTPQVLAVLVHYHVPATFFLIGEQVAGYPNVVQQEALDGNAVEDHTWTHPNLNLLSVANVAAELGDTEQAINRTLGAAEVTLFRPPYGNVDGTVLRVAGQLHLTAIKWNVDPQDWARPGTNVIISRVLAQTRNGSIILMHDGGGNRSQTVAALPQIIVSLQQRGYRFVTVPQLLADSGFKG